MKEKKTKKKEKKKDEPKHMFASGEEQIDYMYGSDPILCQALKNCLDDE